MSPAATTVARVPARADPRSSAARPWLLLSGVALVYLVIVAATGLHRGISHDEAVYLTKADASVPDISWEPWRALGTALLMTPLNLLPHKPDIVRSYTVLLSCVGLVLCFRPWSRLVGAGTAALAALLFATSWNVIYFGPAVQPNFWVAVGSVAAAGLLAQTLVDGPTRRRHAGMAAAVAFVALLRPSDSLWLVLPLGLASLIVRRRLALRTIASLAAGLALGWLPWVIESYARFGGPLQRYRAANSANAVGGFHPNLLTPRIYLRLLDGPFYGYPGKTLRSIGGYDAPWMWWLAAVALLLLTGLVLTRRTTQALPLRIAAATAGSLYVFYGVLLSYGAVRFMLPTLALAFLPLAAGLVAVLRLASHSMPVLALLAGLTILTLHVVLQLPKASQLVQAGQSVELRTENLSKDLRAMSLRKPCLFVSTRDPAPLAWELGCSAAYLQSDSTPATVSRARKQGSAVVVVTDHTKLPAAFAGWTGHPAPGVGPHWQIWLPPGPSSS